MQNDSYSHKEKPFTLFPKCKTDRIFTASTVKVPLVHIADLIDCQGEEPSNWTQKYTQGLGNSRFGPNSKAVLPDEKIQKSPKEVGAKIATFSPEIITQI